MNFQAGPTVVASYPSTQAEFGAYALHIGVSLTNHETLTNPPVVLDDYKKNVSDFIASLAQTSTVSTTERNEMAVQIYRSIRSIVGYVQSVSDTMTSEAASIALITSAGLQVRKVAGHKKPALAARYTGVSTELLLVALVVAGAGAYYWEMSKDNVSWTALPETRDPHTKVTGLIVGQTYWFRFHALTSAGKQDPVGPISMIAH
jgi:hypothetical protein